ncbi:MAG: [FeFe] hydrogenase H-cluster radical SAM maturase HydE [Halanaerobiales bacterium]
MKNIIAKLYKRNELKRDELIYLLENLNDFWKDKLFKLSQKAVIENYGRKIFLRGLLEFSNYCHNDCLYCGLRKSNTNVSRYRLSLNEIINSFEIAAKLGYKTLVLQSGEDKYFTDDRLISIISQIKSRYTDVAVTLSIGERSYQSYQKLFEAGADRYLLRHETVNDKQYNNFHPDMNFKNRVKCLINLDDIGYQTGAGFIVGLPGQTIESIADNLLFLKKHDLDMVGLGPLIPHPDTPLAGCSRGSVEMTLVCYALTRLLLPKTLIPATTALNTLDERGWEKGIRAGANVVMPNLSPAKSRDKYEIYQNKGDTDVSMLKDIKKRIKKTGFEVDMGRGDSIKWLNQKRRKNNE